MADATLIQGARQLAEAQSGVNTGAAFGAGYDKAMARNQAEMNRMLKQQQAAEKRAKDILKEGDKYMREYVVKGVNSVIKGETGGLTTEDMQHATEYLTAQKGALSEGKTLLEKGYSVSDPEAIKQARFMGEEAESNAVSFHNQLSLLQEARKEYAALKNSGNLAAVEGNIKNIENANRLMTSNWSVKEGEIVFDDGTRLVDISLPYTTDIGKGFMEWAGSETDKVSKMTATELNKATTKKENIRSTAEGYFSGEEGVDRLEVLLSQQYFKSLNTGFANIVLDRENPQVAIDQAVEATVNAIYGVAKKDSPAASATQTNVVRPQLAATVSDMQALEKEILSAGPSARPPADITETFKFGDKNNPDQIKVKWDTKENKWKYLNSKSMDKALYNTLEDLMVANPTIFYK